MFGIKRWIVRVRPSFHAAVLAMDGTGDEFLNRQLFGPTLQHERIAIERDAFTTGTIGKKIKGWEPSEPIGLWLPGRAAGSPGGAEKTRPALDVT